MQPCSFILVEPWWSEWLWACNAVCASSTDSKARPRWILALTDCQWHRRLDDTSSESAGTQLTCHQRAPASSVGAVTQTTRGSSITGHSPLLPLPLDHQGFSPLPAEKMVEFCSVLCGLGAILIILFFFYKKNRAIVKIHINEICQRLKDLFMAQTKEERILEFVLKNAVRGDPQSVVDNIDRYCSSKEWAMNVGDEKGLILDKIVKETNPSVLLELGTYCGYSAVRIGRLLKPDARFFTLEMNPKFAEVAKQMLEFAGLKDKVQILEGATHDIIPQLKKKYEVDTLDFVFVDHWKDKYKPDTLLLESCNLLRKGSVILADNVIVPGAPDFLDYVRTCGKYDCTNYLSHLEYMNEEDALEKAVFRGQV